MKDIGPILQQLNPEQREAVLQTDGPVLIIAGAGSGKTRVITTRIAYLIAKGLAAPDSILAVTFTNKAAGEMRERVASLVGKELAKSITISTFHSFCVRVLREEIEQLGYRRNFTISSESDVRTLVRRSLDDLEGIQESFDAGMVLEHISTIKSTGATPETLPVAKGETDATQKYRQWLPEIYDRYQSALRAANTVDFDDLLLLTLRLLQEHPDVLARYQAQFRYVMVDEYQDTNRVQYSLLRALAGGHGNLCVVGDDDQSIYGWRGADIRNLLDFERDFRKARIITLSQNYRSRETILKAANAVIRNNRHRRDKNLWSTLGPGRPIDFFTVADEEQEAKEAVAWLKHIQSKSEAKYSDFLILYRSNLQSRPFEIAFRQAGIPYIVVGGQEFYERAEIKDIVAYLKAIANPRDEAAFLRVANMPRRGIGDTTLHQVHELCRTRQLSLGKGLAALVEQGGLTPATRGGIQEFLGILSEFRGRFHDCHGKLGITATDLVDRIGYRDELLRTSKSPAQFEARWSNIQALLTSMSEYESTVESPTLTAFLDQSALVTDDDRRGRDKHKTPGATLMTVHSAKGLEYPFVFIVGIEEGLMPHDKSLKGDALEEERRLFYVALTRAQRHVTLFHALSRERFGKSRLTKPSRFLSEIPEDLLQPQIRAAQDMIEAHLAPPKPKKRKPRRRK